MNFDRGHDVVIPEPAGFSESLTNATRILREAMAFRYLNDNETAHAISDIKTLERIRERWAGK